MEFREDLLEPVSPTGQYLNSSVLSLSILRVLESETPIDNFRVFSVLKDHFFTRQLALLVNYGMSS